MTGLEGMAGRLGQLAGAPVRPFSTYDFGREREPRARSVIVPQERSLPLLAAIRSELVPGLIAFLGTRRWLGEEHPEGVELVVTEGESQFDALRLARTDANDSGMGTEELIARLMEYDRTYGIDILHAGSDSVDFAMRHVPEDLGRFAEDLADFCADSIWPGPEAAARLAERLRSTGYIRLWWD